MSKCSVKISKSDSSTKKLKAVFEGPCLCKLKGKPKNSCGGKNKKKTIHFGYKGMSDFTKHKDVERKKRYIARHSKNNQNWRNPMSAGALSRFILWNKPTLSASITDFKRRFKLN